MANCTNCGAVLAGEFCQDCGQRRFVESDRRFGHLVDQFVGSVTDVDGRIWRTLRALLFQPGLLSREYMVGRRAHWLAPVTLILAVSVVYFLAPLHGGDLSLQFNQQVSGRMRALAVDPDTTLSDEQRAATGQLHSRYTDRWIEARVQARDAAERAATHGANGYSYRDYRIAYDAKADDVSKALVMLHLPFMALALMLLFAPKRHYFAEHFVVALHFLAFAILALQIVVQADALEKYLLPAEWAVPASALDWLMRTLLSVYAVLALHRAYAVGWLWSIAAACGLLAAAVYTNLMVYRVVEFMVTFAVS